jgi:hypothetical protein
MVLKELSIQIFYFCFKNSQHEKFSPAPIQMYIFSTNIHRFMPQQPRRCSLHATPSNRKLEVGDKFNNLLSNQHKQHGTQFDEFNHRIQQQAPFKRNASTSTLDLVHGDTDGDSLSGKSNHRVITKDKSSVSNKINNFCGIRNSKSKESNIGDSFRRLKSAKNVYYIEERKDEEPNIFIIDPTTVNKHKKFHQVRKSLEDVRIHKINNSSQYTEAYENKCDGWNFMDRNFYGSRTLPRDFSRRTIRPSLDNLLNNSQQQHSSEVNR